MKNRNGFTLIELLILIAIIFILLAIAVPQFQLYKERQNKINHLYKETETDKQTFDRCQIPPCN